jgi:hypothetical protein
MRSIWTKCCAATLSWCACTATRWTTKMFWCSGAHFWGSEGVPQNRDILRGWEKHCFLGTFDDPWQDARFRTEDNIKRSFIHTHERYSCIARIMHEKCSPNRAKPGPDTYPSPRRRRKNVVFWWTNSVRHDRDDESRTPFREKPDPASEPGEAPKVPKNGVN